MSAVGSGAPSACSVCGAPLEPGDGFCMVCGQSVGASPPTPQSGAGLGSTCARCGAALVPGDGFCMNCGEPVGALSASAAPAGLGAAESCSFCGTLLLADDSFCAGCGRAVSTGGQLASPGQVSSYAASGFAAPAAQRPASPPVASGVLIDPVAPDRCPACGIELSEAERFCRGCGRLIKRAKR